MFTQIASRINLVEIIVAVIMFIVVRSIIWFLRQAENIGKTEIQRLMHRHIHNDHPGHYSDCTECAITVIDELTL